MMTGCVLEAFNDELPCLQYVVIVKTEGPLYLSYVAVTRHNEVPKLVIIHRNYKAVCIPQHSKSSFVWYFLNIHHIE
jgi:hypothetical protein